MSQRGDRCRWIGAFLIALAVLLRRPAATGNNSSSSRGHPSLPAAASSSRLRPPSLNNDGRSLDRWNNCWRSDSLPSQTEPQVQDIFYFPHGYPFPGARNLLHLSVKSTSPRWCPAAPASISPPARPGGPAPTTALPKRSSSNERGVFHAARAASAVGRVHHRGGGVGVGAVPEAEPLQGVFSGAEVAVD